MDLSFKSKVVLLGKRVLRHVVAASVLGAVRDQEFFARCDGRRHDQLVASHDKVGLAPRRLVNDGANVKAAASNAAPREQPWVPIDEAAARK